MEVKTQKYSELDIGGRETCKYYFLPAHDVLYPGHALGLGGLHRPSQLHGEGRRLEANLSTELPILPRDRGQKGDAQEEQETDSLQ